MWSMHSGRHGSCAWDELRGIRSCEANAPLVLAQSQLVTSGAFGIVNLEALHDVVTQFVDVKVEFEMAYFASSHGLNHNAATGCGSQ